MYKKALITIQNKVQAGNIYITEHAEEELIAERFFVEDVIKGILSGKIVERQADELTIEWKYKIVGNSTQIHRKISVIVVNRKDAVVITVFEEI